MKLLVYYVVESHLEVTKQAVFAAGGGAYAQFDQCCWQTLGAGQYREQGQAVAVNEEYKVEVLCQLNIIDAVIHTLKSAHPCDDPAYYLVDVTS